MGIDSILVGIGVVVRVSREVHHQRVTVAGVLIRVPDAWRDVEQARRPVAEVELGEPAVALGVHPSVVKDHTDTSTSATREISIGLKLVHAPALDPAWTDGELVCVDDGFLPERSVEVDDFEHRPAMVDERREPRQPDAVDRSERHATGAHAGDVTSPMWNDVEFRRGGIRVRGNRLSLEHAEHHRSRSRYVPNAITVVIPTHDRRDTMLLALGSALSQTRRPAQVLVVADGCSDGTADAVRGLGDPRVEVLDLPKGPGYGYGHRNEALRRARGDVVAWLADDDLYLPDHLERVGAIFDAEQADLVSTPACIVHEDDRLEALWTDWGIPFYRELFLRGENRTPASAVSHTLRSAIDVGGWRAELPREADMDLWQRMLLAGARPVSTSAPTVLHFRATTRDQDYADRVRQNSSFAARLRRPHEQAALRSEMDRAVHRRTADVEQRARAAEQARTDAEVAVRRAHEEVAQLRTVAEQALQTLDAVYAGGWWRMRGRLQPALSIARRLVRPTER